MVTRREMLGGLGAVAATYATEGSLVKGNLGAFGSAFLKKPTGKVWTWKEMFFNLTLNTWKEKVVMPEDVNKIGRSFWLNSENGDIKDICFLSQNIVTSKSYEFHMSHLLDIRAQP